MRLPLNCMQCVLEKREKAHDELYPTEFRDDGRYEIRCSYGHSTITLLSQQKFELLFDIGAYAIVDGYYREAISSFSSSLERFYEYAIRIFLERLTKSDELFQSGWSTIKNQSERQLGAFIFLWMQQFKEVPVLLTNSKIEFRNSVIHKGKIPSRDEALNYGNSVLDVIRPKLNKIKEIFPEEISNLSRYHQMESQLAKDEGKQKSFMGILTLLSLTFTDTIYQTGRLEQYVTMLEERRRSEFGVNKIRREMFHPRT